MADQPGIASPSMRKHKRDLGWKIIIPIVLVGVLILAAASYISLGTGGSISMWRDISLVWILIPALLMAFFSLVIMVAAIYGMARLTKAVPGFTSRVQELIMMGTQGIRNVVGATTKPFIWLGQAGAALRSIFKRRF